MKKIVLTSITGLLAMSSAQATPQLYGKAGLILNYQDADKNYTDRDSGSTTLESFSSRIGLKGSETLTSDMSVIYQLEYRIKVDDNSTQFKSRDTYIGINHNKYGELKIGRLSTIDGDVDYAFQNYTNKYDNDYGGSTWNGFRANNSISYKTPNYKGLRIGTMYSMDENNSSDISNDLPYYYNVTTGSGNLEIVNAIYEPEKKPYRGGIAYVHSGEFSSTRVSTGYDINKNTKVGGLYQVSKSGINSKPKEHLFALGGTYKTSMPWSIYLEGARIKNMKFNDGKNSRQYVLGADYDFNQSTTGLLYIGYQKVDANQSSDSFNVMNIGTGLLYRF